MKWLLATRKTGNSALALILAITCLCSCAQKGNLRTDNAATKSEKQLSLIHDLEKASGFIFLHSDTTYASATGTGITIQNSGPKGGNIEPEIPYVDSSGKQYFFAAFWTRIINQTDSAFEIDVNFPGDSFPLSSESGAYLKLFLPIDTMTVEKLRLYSYGLTGMKSFVDENFSNATTMQKTIKPNEGHMFYIVTISHQAGGPARSSLVLKEKELFYRISMGPYGPLEIPCGKIAFVNEDGI